MSQQNSNKKSPRKNNNRRHHNKNNRNRNNSQNSKNSGGGGQRKRHFNKNRRPKNLTPSRVLQKYDNLLEQYIIARKKYFELYGRNSTKNLPKTLKNYESALKSLRDFESKLEDWQKEVLSKKVDGYAPDREYSSNHDLKPEGDQVSFVGEFEDPHLLDTQKSENWSSDTEESSGTMEDYEKYKASQA